MIDLYIDYTGSVALKGKKFHGGSYYTKNTIIFIMEKLSAGNNQFKLHVFWPAGYEPIDDYEKRIVTSELVEIKRITDIKYVTGLNENSRVMIPLISIKKWGVFKTLKENNPGIKLFVTIHGLRIDDLSYDSYDAYYGQSVIRNSLNRFLIPLKKIYLRYLCRAKLKYVDKIFTVSNYTMQSLLKICPVSFIKPYYQGVFNPDEIEKTSLHENFILFVSANRPEKNFVRGLEGFIEYKKRNPGDLVLYVTGTKDYLKNRIYKSHIQEKDIIEKYVRFCGYVDNDVLSAYYSCCKFLLYTSKSEGFGLPVLEMALRGKATVASAITSIPEVLGPAVYYVDPYNIESIANGIEYMAKPEILREYEKNVTELKAEIQKKIKVNKEILLYDILN